MLLPSDCDGSFQGGTTMKKVSIVTEYLVTQVDRDRVARRRMRPVVNHEVGEVDLGDIDLMPQEETKNVRE
jgi:hypothetical protein